ncbi:hypothetical protein ACHAXM_001301 [Skeletonema potamos]
MTSRQSCGASMLPTE